MATKKKVTSAKERLQLRHKDDVEYKKLVSKAKEELGIAQQLYDQRKKAGLTQKQLAARVNTTPSVISRLEDADYDGHSLKMLKKIAVALNLRLKIKLEKA